MLHTYEYKVVSNNIPTKYYSGGSPIIGASVLLVVLITADSEYTNTTLQAADPAVHILLLYAREHAKQAGGEKKRQEFVKKRQECVVRYHTRVLV